MKDAEYENISAQGFVYQKVKAGISSSVVFFSNKAVTIHFSNHV